MEHRMGSINVKYIDPLRRGQNVSSVLVTVSLPLGSSDRKLIR
jgi:hypothetical protein